MWGGFVGVLSTFRSSERTPRDLQQFLRSVCMQARPFFIWPLTHSLVVIPMMLKCFVAALMLSLCSGSEYTTKVNSNQEVCFFEDLPEGTPIRLETFVVAGGNLDIRMKVRKW